MTAEKVDWYGKDWVDAFENVQKIGKNIPVEPGFYWAMSHESYRDYNIIIKIEGKAPYLSYIAWFFTKNIVISGVRPEYIFGPKIDEVQLEGN